MKSIKPKKEFTATLTTPSGESETYTVDARGKTEARQQIAKSYRENTPSARNGFYSFAQCRLEWTQERDI